ncbi:MAG: hypothetical protein ACOYLF_17180, partial [Blastocatellia bacterium]
PIFSTASLTRQTTCWINSSVARLKAHHKHQMQGRFANRPRHSSNQRNVLNGVFAKGGGSIYFHRLGLMCQIKAVQAVNIDEFIT